MVNMWRLVMKFINDFSTLYVYPKTICRESLWGKRSTILYILMWLLKIDIDT